MFCGPATAAERCSGDVVCCSNRCTDMPHQAGAGVLLGAFVHDAVTGLLLQPKCPLGVVGLVGWSACAAAHWDSAQRGMSRLPSNGSTITSKKFLLVLVRRCGMLTANSLLTKVLTVVLAKATCMDCCGASDNPACCSTGGMHSAFTAQVVAAPHWHITMLLTGSCIRHMPSSECAALHVCYMLRHDSEAALDSMQALPWQGMCSGAQLRRACLQ